MTAPYLRNEPHVVTVHPQLLEWLRDSATPQFLRRKAVAVLRQLLETGNVANTRPVFYGINHLWKRSPVGGTNGKQFYLWWLPHDQLHRLVPREVVDVVEKGIDNPSFRIYARAVRHHDDTMRHINIGLDDEWKIVTPELLAGVDPRRSGEDVVYIEAPDGSGGGMLKASLAERLVADGDAVFADVPGETSETSESSDADFAEESEATKNPPAEEAMPIPAPPEAPAPVVEAVPPPLSRGELFKLVLETCETDPDKGWSTRDICNFLGVTDVTSRTAVYISQAVARHASTGALRFAGGKGVPSDPFRYSVPKKRDVVEPTLRDFVGQRGEAPARASSTQAASDAVPVKPPIFTPPAPPPPAPPPLPAVSRASVLARLATTPPSGAVHVATLTIEEPMKEQTPISKESADVILTALSHYKVSFAEQIEQANPIIKPVLAQHLNAIEAAEQAVRSVKG